MCPVLLYFSGRAINHTLDNSLLNMPIGLSIGWGIANRKSTPIITCNRRVKMSIDARTCFFNQKVRRNWYNRLLFSRQAYSYSIGYCPRCGVPINRLGISPRQNVTGYYL